MPGSTPPTSQLDWLISTTAMIVLSWSRATRDLLKSFGWGIRALHQLVAATMVPSPRRLPHTISPLEGDGFALPVPRKRDSISSLYSARETEDRELPGSQVAESGLASPSPPQKRAVRSICLAGRLDQQA